MKTIAVIGGSGFIGRHIVHQLRLRGFQPRVVARGPVQRPGSTRDVVTCDPAEVDSLRTAIRGCDAVMFLPGILHGRPQDFEEVHVRLPDRVMEACRREGIVRYVHMSALGADANGPSWYLRSKGQGEERVRRSSLQWTVFRPSVVFGEGDQFLSLFARMVRLCPVIPLAGAHARFQPVWVDDVAHAFVETLNLPDTISQCFDLVGPEVYTLADLVRLCARFVGRRCLVVPLPPAIARVQAAVLEQLPGPLMSRDNLDSMRVDNVSARDFPEVFGRQSASLEVIAPGYLGAPSRRAT